MDWRDKLNALKQDLPEGEEVPVVNEPINKRQQEPLRIELDKRNGKPATIISQFEGTEDELKELGKTLRVKCSSGGSSRDGEILIQGDFREKIAEILADLGYKVKRINFPTPPTVLKNQSGHRKF
ncbi:MAG: translation initiation factor [Paludibacter sp.]|nr:translation initiation factor [Paludibacter sp.]MDD4197937.1 translation initiation factor [Paludibacter sp.]MDD4427248.1 translation initiation factor [Paludibacter sp.]